VLGLVVAILALYLASVPLHLEWFVIAAVIVALIIAAVPGVIRPIGRAVTAAIRYPAVVKQLGEVQEQLEESGKEVGALRALAEGRHQAGVKLGRREVVGEVLGRIVDKKPALIAVAGDAGHLKLIGRYEEGSEVRVGARFEAVVQITGDKRGVVEVVAVDKENRRVELRCVERTSDGFWSALEGRVEADAEPPAGIELRGIEWGPDWGPGIGSVKGGEGN
jgi:hypothetical protein